MLDLLSATLAATGLVAVGLGLLACFTLLPFFLTLQRADALRFSTARWGAISLAGSSAAIGFALLVLVSDRSPLLALLGLPLAGVGPLLLATLRGDARVGGRAGDHE